MRIITASGDKTARLWDAASGKELAVLRGHEQSVVSAAFSPDGTRIITASGDTARLWDAASGKELAVLRGHEQSVVSAAFSPDGMRILTISFELDGQYFTALNGGPDHKFNEAVSFWVRCQTQEEVDYYWEKLTAGGQEIACGWLRDKFGLCWQIVPETIGEILKHPKAMAAMMTMVKFDIATLEAAAREA